MLNEKFKGSNDKGPKMTRWAQVASFVTGTPTRDDLSVSRSLALWTDGKVQVSEQRDGITLHSNKKHLCAVELKYPISRVSFDLYLDMLSDDGKPYAKSYYDPRQNGTADI